MSGTGWNCNLSNLQAVSCTRSDVLAPGASYPSITLTVYVAADAPNPADAFIGANVGGQPGGFSQKDETTIVDPPAPNLLVASSRGNFVRGNQRTYKFTVSNAAGAGPTNGTPVTFNESSRRSDRGKHVWQRLEL